MAIPDPPPDPTYFRVLLTDPEGFDARLISTASAGRLRRERVADRRAVAARDGATDEEVK